MLRELWLGLGLGLGLVLPHRELKRLLRQQPVEGSLLASLL